MKTYINARIVVGMLVGAMTLGASASARADMSVTPAKNAAYFSQNGVAIPIADTTIATVTIVKGKKKRVLEVVGILDSTSIGAFTAIGLRGHVNGIAMEPTGPSYQTTQGCGSVQGCTAQGLWWIDLDQAEALYPGMFINQPLVVTMKSSVVGTAGTAAVSLRAKLVKP